MANQQNSRVSTTPSQQPTLTVSPTAPGSNLVKPPSAAFAKALAEFRKRLTVEELAKFQNTTYDQFCQDLGDLQEKQRRRREMMNLSRIEAFLEGIHQLGKTIEVFVNASDMVAFIWGPIRFLLLTGSVYADSFEDLLEAYEQIGEQLPLVLDRELLFRNNPSMTTALEWIYMDILRFHQKAIRFFHGNRVKTILKGMWKNFDTEFKGILASLKRHKELVEQYTSIAHYTDSAAHYRQHQIDMDLLHKQWEQRVEEDRLKRLVTVREWLAVSPQSKGDHDEHRKTRKEFPTTATWIYRHEYIKDWLKADLPASPLLWMHGIPGAGKTVLASAIIDSCKQIPEFLTTFVYCRDGDSNSNSAIAILKGLADMLLDVVNYRDLLLPSFYSRRTSGGDASLRSINQAKLLLEDCFRIVPKMFIVIDGLDECDPKERREALRVLINLIGTNNDTAPGQVRLLVVSQYYHDIQREMESSGATRIAPRIIRLFEKDTSSDIKAYIRVWVDKIAAKNSSPASPFTEDTKEYLKNLTFVNAKGMFLYAKLVLTNMYALHTRQEVIEAMQKETFPHGLKEAVEANEDARQLRQDMLTGHFAFQDYAIATWFHHLDAFVHKGKRLLAEVTDHRRHLDVLCEALEDFILFYDEKDWEGGTVQDCRDICRMFEPYALYDNLVLIMSHIYTFQHKGFHARQKISIKGLEAALERNRKLIEEPPKDLTHSEKEAYSKFYDDKRPFNCNKITCRYFSQGFSDKKARKRHVNIHDRPYQCEVFGCLGQEGFANEMDLRNHKRSYHPEMCDLAETFRSSITKRANAIHTCTYCGKTFTRKFHRENHEKSHRGERPHACPECGKAFTRKNDCDRHRNLHERVN
ncbi:hypothetical protein ACEQ8H_000355 [Pleosporales sp. CAS-2024a]